MKSLSQLGIVTREGKRTTCPLCEEPDVLTVIKEGETYLFNCVSCCQNGSTENGWFDDKHLEQGYMPLDESSVYESVMTAYIKGFDHGIPTGWPSVDQHYTVRKGEVTIITGIPNHGKSEWLDALIMNMAKLYNWHLALYSPENLPFHVHVSKMLEKYVGKPFSPRAKEKQMTPQERDQAYGWVAKHFDFVYPKKRSIDDILATTEILIKKKQIDGVVIDPWNEIEHSRPAHLNETEYISLMLTKIRTFARMKKIALWLVVHPKKMGKTDAGKQEVPTPYDLAGSAHFYNKADNIITIWRDVQAEEHMKELVEIHVQKVRFKTVGKPGMTKLIYDWETGRYRVNS